MRKIKLNVNDKKITSECEIESTLGISTRIGGALSLLITEVIESDVSRIVK